MDERRRKKADEATENTAATSEAAGGKETYWILAYVLTAFLTFGAAYNATAPRCAYEYCQFDRAVGSAMRGVFWPVYFAGKAAIAVTKPIVGAAS